jgi:RNA polymerase-binding transcription factor DksA
MANESDNLDRATEVEESFRDAAMRRLQRQEKVPSEFDGMSCTECDCEIPQGRLALGKFRCVECQDFREKSGKMFVRQ